MSSVHLTLLNSMASQDFEESLRVHQEWGLEWMDIKDSVYNYRVQDLPVETATKAKEKIDDAGLKVYCLSTRIFFADIERGEEFFHQELMRLDHVIALSKILRQKLTRIVAAQLPSRSEGQSAMDLIEGRHPWLIEVYREAIDRFTDAGLNVTIENEAFRCFLSEVEDFQRFFEALDRKGKVGLTWDVQNHWATGVFPTREVYEQLRPLMHYYHVKGGQGDGSPQRRLQWNVALEDADWPVLELTQAVVDDGTSPVICLNPAQHGDQKPGYNYDKIVKRDLDFLRTHIDGVQ